VDKSHIKEDIIMIIVISFFGFVFEDLWMILRYSVVDNRNMFLPFLFGYGFFVVLIYYIIGTPKNIFNKYEFDSPINYAIYIALCFLLVSVGEILLGSVVEILADFKYWDYSHIPLHFTKYTSVPTSLGFSLVITLFMNYVYNPLLNTIKKIEKKIPMTIAIIVFVILMLDLNVSFKNMHENNGNNTVWSVKLKA